jgi:POT family proton-dependent oligopeptide transporter
MSDTPSSPLEGQPMNPAVTPITRRHPRGLATLFLTEMWERFSYYGMRSLLVLFMVDQVRGGPGLDDKTATAIYGIYTAAVYLMSLPGGWLADRVCGARRAVWIGGLIIAAGHFTLALPRMETFYLGLALVVVGSGLLKPNMSALVAELYPEGGARRDAGFTIFYMGVNLGAFLGPLVCSTLGEKLNWHYGFGAAGVGMVLGLLQFRFFGSRLGSVGWQRGNNRPLNLAERAGMGGLTTVLLAVIGLALTGFLKLNPVVLAHGMAALVLVVGALYFVGVFLFCGLNVQEKERVAVILVLFLASALFWAGFEQAGSSFNLFAERMTDRHLLGWEIPAGWFQSLGAIFVIAFAPVFAGLWVWLARRNLDPSIPVKFAYGLLLLAAGFLVMVGAAKVVAGGGRAAPTWLVTTYLLHTFGELCLSPVGLSSVTKLAPRKLVGQMMGLWFLATSLGNLIAGLLAGEFRVDAVDQWPGLYWRIAVPPVLAGILLVVCARPIKRWLVGVK